MNRSTARALGAVTLGALAVRVAYVLVEHRHSPVFGDAFSYHHGANLLADGLGYVDPLRYEVLGIRVPSAYHPPLYLTYLAGWSLLGFDGHLAHRLASTLLGAATVLVVGLVARRLAGNHAGVAAAALAALSPSLWLNEGMLLSEPAAALAVACFLLAVVAFRDRPTTAHAALAGAAIGLCALGRAELVLLGPLVGIPLALAARALPLRIRLARLAVMGATTAVVLAPWVAHNLARFEEPVLLSTGLGPSVAAAYCDDAFAGEKLGYWTTCRIEQVEPPPPDRATVLRWVDDPDGTRAERRAYFAPYFASEPDESVADRLGREQAWEYLRAHERRLPVVVAARVGRLWGLYRPWQTATFDGEIEGRGVGWARAALGAHYLYTALAVAGVVLLRRLGQPVWEYGALALVATAAAAITFGVQRYRIPVDVALPVLGGVALTHWPPWRAGRVPRPA